MRVYEVATFYTMFNRNPVGKYFVQVGRRLNVNMLLMLIGAANVHVKFEFICSLNFLLLGLWYDSVPVERFR